MAKRIKTAKRRRVCRFSGCKHILSIYNPDNYCYVHQQIVLAQNAAPVLAGRR